MQTGTPEAEPPKRKRRWLQFSLRTLFGVTTIVAVATWSIRVAWPASIPLVLLVLLWAGMLVAIIGLADGRDLEDAMSRPRRMKKPRQRKRQRSLTLINGGLDAHR